MQPTGFPRLDPGEVVPAGFPTTRAEGRPLLSENTALSARIKTLNPAQLTITGNTTFCTAGHLALFHVGNSIKMPFSGLASPNEMGT